MPSDWPAPTISASDCSEISGNYIDPNTVRGKSVTHYKNGYSESGGTFDAGWLIFGFYSAARSGDPTVKSRHFSLAFDSRDALVVTYYIDGEPVATKEIAASEYRCEEGTLKFVSYTRIGEQAFDKLPNKGTITHSLELRRSSTHLYAKFTRDTVAVSYGVIPDSHMSITWPCFPVQ